MKIKGSAAWLAVGDKSCLLADVQASAAERPMAGIAGAAQRRALLPEVFKPRFLKV